MIVQFLHLGQRFAHQMKDTMVIILLVAAAISLALCVYEHDARSTAAQPLLQTMKTIRDSIDF